MRPVLSSTVKALSSPPNCRAILCYGPRISLRSSDHLLTQCHTCRASTQGRTARQFSTSGRSRKVAETSTRSTVPRRESILPQTHYDFFPETLGSDSIPPRGTFAIDVKDLRREFLKLQSKAHPDLAPADQKRQAEGLSARINEAYKTLQNPLSRAQYLLSLKGVDVAGDETAKVDDPELLMDVLEARETIEAAEDEADLEEVQANNETNIETSIQELSEAFAADDVERAEQEAIKLRYWMNIKESVDNWEKGKPVVLIH